MLKDSILQDFEDRRGEPLSGQFLAEKYNVSRNAVWKAVNSLKEEGYNIVSVKNRGYYLDISSDKVSVQSIRSFLPDSIKKMNLICLEEIDSTNNEMKRHIIDGIESPSIIYADMQTGGRGRLGRSFYSPSGKGIYMSLYYRVPGGVRNPMLITMAAAVAVIDAIEKLTDIKPSVKWVNDIYIGDRKTAGILTEAVTDLETGLSENVIVGIGINVKKEDFPSDIRYKVTSLGKDDLNRSEFVAEIASGLLKYYADMNPDDFMDKYISHSNVSGKRVKYEVNGESVIGKVIEVMKDGALSVRREDGTLDNITTGEILFHESKQ